MAGTRRRGGRRHRRRRQTSPLQRLLPLIVLGVAAAAAFLIWVGTRPETGETQAAVCVVVLDRTGSSNDDLTVTRYRQLAKSAVTGCREKRARLAIYFFDQQSQKLVLANDEGFKLWLPRGRKRSTQENALNRTLEDAQKVAQTVFNQPSGDARGSDILTAFNEAAENLNNQARADRVDERYLVMLTDGIQLSTDVSVEAFSSESVAVEPLVDRARSVGLVPMTLEGTQVSFVGVRSGAADTGDQLPQWFEAKVEEFWRQVVDEAGGSMCTYVVDSQVLPVSC